MTTEKNAATNSSDPHTASLRSRRAVTAQVGDGRIGGAVTAMAVASGSVEGGRPRLRPAGAGDAPAGRI